jgi:hypothetical protein
MTSVEPAADAPFDFKSRARDRAVALFREDRGGSTWSPIIVYAAFLAIAYGSRSGTSLPTIAAVAGAMAFRDLGRFAGVHLLGYPDRELLLLPFLRKTLPAEGDRGERWKQGLIVMLGPLPGLLLAFILAIVTRFVPGKAIGQAILSVTLINAMMLLPLRSFDGGRLLNIVLFSRSRWVELGFALLTAGALFYAASRFDSVIYVLIAVASLLYARSRFQIARASMAIRARRPDLPRKPADVPDDAAGELFDEADTLVPRALSLKARAGDATPAPTYAMTMRRIHDGAVMTPPSAVASLLLLVLYGTGIVLAAATIFVTILGHRTLF